MALYFRISYWTMIVERVGDRVEKTSSIGSGGLPFLNYQPALPLRFALNPLEISTLASSFRMERLDAQVFHLLITISHPSVIIPRTNIHPTSRNYDDFSFPTLVGYVEVSSKVPNYPSCCRTSAPAPCSFSSPSALIGADGWICWGHLSSNFSAVFRGVVTAFVVSMGLQFPQKFFHPEFFSPNCPKTTHKNRQKYYPLEV